MVNQLQHIDTRYKCTVDRYSRGRTHGSIHRYFLSNTMNSLGSLMEILKVIPDLNQYCNVHVSDTFYCVIMTFLELYICINAQDKDQYQL